MAVSELDDDAATPILHADNGVKCLVVVDNDVSSLELSDRNLNVCYV
jgi:hypothetical protein